MLLFGSGIDPVDEGRKNPPQTEFGKPKSKGQENREYAETVSQQSKFRGDKPGLHTHDHECSLHKHSASTPPLPLYKVHKPANFWLQASCCCAIVSDLQE